VPSELTGDAKVVVQTSVEGDRRTLVTQSVILVSMAVTYLLLALYFKRWRGIVRAFDDFHADSGTL
jgi:hypothetical protein